MTYCAQTKIPGGKNIDIKGNMATPSFNQAYTAYHFLFRVLMQKQPYVTFDSGQWAIFINYFELKKWNDCTKCSSENKKYPHTKYSDLGRHLLCSIEAFKTDITEFAELGQTIKGYKWKPDEKQAYLD